MIVPAKKRLFQQALITDKRIILFLSHILFEILNVASPIKTTRSTPTIGTKKLDSKSEKAAKIHKQKTGIKSKSIEIITAIIVGILFI